MVLWSAKAGRPPTHGILGFQRAGSSILMHAPPNMHVSALPCSLRIMPLSTAHKSHAPPCSRPSQPLFPGDQRQRPLPALPCRGTNPAPARTSPTRACPVPVRCCTSLISEGLSWSAAGRCPRATPWTLDRPRYFPNRCASKLSISALEYVNGHLYAGEWMRYGRCTCVCTVALPLESAKATSWLPLLPREVFVTARPQICPPRPALRAQGKAQFQRFIFTSKGVF